MLSRFQLYLIKHKELTEIISEFQSISESISGLATTVSDECCTAVATIIKA